MQDFGQKIKSFFVERRDDVYIFLIVVVVAVLSFGLGRLSALSGQGGGLEIIYPEEEANQAAAALLPLLALEEGGRYVASKTGTTYYFPWCGNAARIREASRVYFDTKEAAERAGYRPGNCSGM